MTWKDAACDAHCARLAEKWASVCVEEEDGETLITCFTAHRVPMVEYRLLDNGLLHTIVDRRRKS